VVSAAPFRINVAWNLSGISQDVNGRLKIIGPSTSTTKCGSQGVEWIDTGTDVDQRVHSGMSAGIVGPTDVRRDFIVVDATLKDEMDRWQRAEAMTMQYFVSGSGVKMMSEAAGGLEVR